MESCLGFKFKLLQTLKARGIWLVDTNIFGWYMTQSTEYVKSKVSGEVVKKSRDRPPPTLKNASLVLSWELFTKHLLRCVVLKGDLKFIIPIGKSVGTAVSRARLEEVIDVENCNTVIEENPPAPNAQVDGGYDRILKKLSIIYDKYK